MSARSGKPCARAGKTLSCLAARQPAMDDLQTAQAFVRAWLCLYSALRTGSAVPRTFMMFHTRHTLPFSHVHADSCARERQASGGIQGADEAAQS